MTTVLEMAELDLDDDVILAIENGTHVNLFEIYKISERQGPIVYNTIGVWSNIDGLQLTTTSKWYRRGNLKVNLKVNMFCFENRNFLSLLFQGHHFKVQTLVETPYTISLDLNDQTEKYEVTGSFPDLLNSLANTMNFTYTIGPPPDMKWGGQQKDGSWNGMMDQVVKDKIDFGRFKLFKLIIFDYYTFNSEILVSKLLFTQPFQLLHL